MSIELRGITKTFGDFRALQDVSLQDVSLLVPTGELVALLGPSGAGKTTLLRIIAGLEVADGGVVLFDDAEVTHRRANDRRVGFVFQHYALFRHMTVFENVAFGLRVKPRRERLSRSVLATKVQELLKLVQLEPLAQRYPAQLSGGQRQRVALARALAAPWRERPRRDGGPSPCWRRLTPWEERGVRQENFRQHVGVEGDHASGSTSRMR